MKHESFPRKTKNSDPPRPSVVLQRLLTPVNFKYPGYSFAFSEVLCWAETLSLYSASWKRWVCDIEPLQCRENVLLLSRFLLEKWGWCLRDLRNSWIEVHNQTWSTFKSTIKMVDQSKESSLGRCHKVTKSQQSEQTSWNIWLFVEPSLRHQRFWCFSSTTRNTRITHSQSWNLHPKSWAGRLE